MVSSQPQRGPQTPWARLAGMGFEFGASLVVFMLVGLWVDHHWQIEGRWGLLIGLLLGLIGGTYNFVREAMLAIRLGNQQDRLKRQESAEQAEKPDDSEADRQG